MKKLLALLLTAVLCLPLAACNTATTVDDTDSTNAYKDYVGKWVNLQKEEYVLELNKGGTKYCFDVTDLVK